jgi:hypothetical protein
VKRSQGVVVDSNVVHDGLGNEIWAEAFYLSNEAGITWTADITWTRNVVYGSVLSAAFQCQDSGSPLTCRLYNNTVHTSANGVFAGHDSGSSNALIVYAENNIFDTPTPQNWNENGYYVWQWDYNDNVQSSTIGPHDLHVDPQFVNAGADNFHLQPTSPVIDRGTNVGLPYVGSLPDLGSFEWGPTP